MRTLTKNLLAGAAGGLLAAFTMSQFQNAWWKAAGTQRRSRRPGTDEEVMAKVASLTARKLGGRLRRRQQRWVGPLLHYTFATALGVAYAAAVEREKTLKMGFGSGFGSAFYVLGDVLSPREFMPAVPPYNQELVNGVYEWLAHVVYGVTLEAGRRGTIALLDRNTRALGP